MARLTTLFAVAFLLGTLAMGGQRGDEIVARLAGTPAVRAALAAVRTNEPQTIAAEMRFTEIPAPGFNEAARGAELRRVFTELGLQDVRIDRAGNVLGERPGAFPHPHVVVAAHLDTVFPEGTDVKTRRQGPVLFGPGVGDNSRGLAVLVAIVRALDQAHVRTPGSLTFVADVGEEGLGNLRGVKELFDVTLKGTVDRFITIDGAGLGVAHTFVGSRRYRVTFKGPGGHSFGAFGTLNPVNALARAVTRISAVHVPATPRTTFNVGRIGGGTSVNSIPGEAWMEVDLRSVDRDALASLDGSVHRAIDDAWREVNGGRQGPGALTVSVALIGERPVGAEPADAFVVEAAKAATRVVGGVPVESMSSSDANYPVALGISSIEIGGGGRGAGVHSVRESFDTTDSWIGTARALLLTIALAQK